MKLGDIRYTANVMFFVDKAESVWKYKTKAYLDWEETFYGADQATVLAEAKKFLEENREHIADKIELSKDTAVYNLVWYSEEI